MEKKTITLTKENYTQYLPLEPVAFSFAELGAMGSPGEIVIINQRSVYCFMYMILRRRLYREFYLNYMNP